MNFDGLGRQQFGSLQPNDPSLAALLQPFLNGSAASGNVNASQLEAIRNAAIAAANSSQPAYANALTASPFALPLNPAAHASTANQAQITSDLLYTQSASSMFFPHPTFHQQSRLTLSSAASFGNPSPIPTPNTSHFLTPPNAHQQQQATINFLSANPSSAEALSSALAGSFNGSPKPNATSLQESQIKEKKLPKNHSINRHSSLSTLTAAPTSAPLPPPSSTSSSFQAPTSASPSTFGGDNMLANSMFSPSLWYSSLAAQSLAALTNQIYFQNALKSAANLPNMAPQLPINNHNAPASTLPLHPSFDALLAATAASQSMHPSFHLPNQYSDANSKLSNAMQPIALLSPNNSRYQQPLPELKISPCDSTKADIDRKKFSPDSSTALHSPLCSPFANDGKSTPTSIQKHNRIKSPIPIKPRLLSPSVLLPSNTLTQHTDQIIANPTGRINTNLTTPSPAHSPNHPNQRPHALAHSPKSSRANPQSAKSVSQARSRPITKRSSPTPASNLLIDNLRRPESARIVINGSTAASINSKSMKPSAKRSAIDSQPASITLEDLKPALNQLTMPTTETNHLPINLPLAQLAQPELLPHSPRISHKRGFGELHKLPAPFDSSSSSSSSTSPSLSSSTISASTPMIGNLNVTSLNYNTQSPIVSSTKSHTSDRHSSSPEMIGSPSLLSQSSHSLSPCAPRLISPQSPQSVASLNRPSLSPPSQAHLPLAPSPLSLSDDRKAPSPISNPVRTRCVPPKKTIQSASTCASYNPLYWCPATSINQPQQVSPRPAPSPSPPNLTPVTNKAESDHIDSNILMDEPASKLIIDEPFIEEDDEEDQESDQKINSICTNDSLFESKPETDIKLAFGNLTCSSAPLPPFDDKLNVFAALKHESVMDPKEKEETEQQKPIPKLSIKLEQVDKYLVKGRKAKRSKRSRNDSQSSGSTTNDLTTPTELLRRHSTDDMLLSKEASGDHHPIEATSRIRCETYSGPEALLVARNKRSSNKKRDSTANLNPWTIRRSERIFLHSAYQSHTNPSESPGSLNLILTSHRKTQKDAAEAAAAAASGENKSNVYTADDSTPNKALMQSGSTSGMFSGSVALMGMQNVSVEDCKLLQLIEWTREDRLPKMSEFKLQRKLLHQQRQRVLLRSDELLYAGQTQCESKLNEDQRASVLLRLDGESNDRHMTLQQLLNQAIREYRPIKLNQLEEGTRVCAFWSNRARCLYPGRVAKVLQNDLVLVEFDDGDKGRIALNDIRLLPEGYTSEMCPTSDVDEIHKDTTLAVFNTSNACSERVGESLIRIRLGSTSDRHKRRKHHHVHTHRKHHLKRRKHKKRNKSAGDEADESGESMSTDSPNGSEGLLCASSDKPSKYTSNAVDDESLDESNDSDSDVESTDANDRMTNDSVSHANDSQSSANNWVCEMNEGRSLRRNSSPTPPCKAVIRRKKTNKKDEPVDRNDKRSQNASSKIAAFLLDRQLWNWHGEPNRTLRGRYRSKKLFYDAIIRDDEVIRVNDCAVFLSTGRPSLPFVGRIDSMWQNPNGTMLVRVRWFYHPEETKTQPKLLDSKVRDRCIDRCIQIEEFQSLN